MKRLLRIGLIVGLVAIIIPTWLGSIVTLGSVVGIKLGLVALPTMISGTGSMYPTFPKGEGTDPQALAEQIVSTQGMFPYPSGVVLFGKRYLGHDIARGDIVIIENELIFQKTSELYGEASGWLKRVVAVAGDQLEIRDGLVYVNGQPAQEPYTARARSTFGQTFLQECQAVTVPASSVFVMGDNRKGSGDSREIGFITLADVTHVLPLDQQLDSLKANWRDTSDDVNESARIILERTAYLTELNRLRAEAGVPALSYQPKLEQSADRRGASMLRYDDYSFAATRSGYTMKKALQDVGYANIVTGEAPTPGYYEADELLENQLEFAASKKFLLDPRFEEIGIAEVQGEINGCPAHIIVQHFAGYQPPDYSADVVSSWQRTIDNLRDVQGGWVDLKNNTRFYEAHKRDVDRLNELIAQRISDLTPVVAKMQANQWLTAAEEQILERDAAWSKEQSALAEKLNNAE